MRIKTLVFKEWSELFRIKMVVFGCLFMPLFMGGFAGYMVWQGRGLPPEAQAALFNAALLYFLILPVMIPITLGVYSVVGEKEQGTLEPLLATPLSDLELFLGKSAVAVIPSVFLTWIVFGLFLLAASLMIPGGIPAGILSLPWLFSIFLLSPLLALTCLPGCGRPWGEPPLGRASHPHELLWRRSLGNPGKTGLPPKSWRHRALPHPDFSSLHQPPLRHGGLLSGGPHFGRRRGPKDPGF